MAEEPLHFLGETQMKSGKGPQVRYTCWGCKEPIGHKDFVSLKQKMEESPSLLELYYCTSCALEALDNISFEEAVEGHVVLKWIGKTWSSEMPLYKKDAWTELRKRLSEGNLFPEDSLLPKK